MPQNKKKAGIISTIIICLLLIVASFFAIAYRQRILDQVAYWSYQPSSEVSSLIDRTGMNDNGKFYFYASQPSIHTKDTADEFNSVCEKVEATTAILGCYNGTKIYIYKIDDKRLDGISEVTAAHETLHAIYSRLDDNEKSKIDDLLEAEYKKIADNKYYSDLTAYYSRAEPGQRANELHSIIGTEIANISQELEDYYGRYFSDRQKIVDLDIKYSNAFKTLKIKADKLGVQLDALSVSISSRTKQYNADAIKLNNDIAAWAASGDFSSQEQFDDDRNDLINRVSALEAYRIGIKNDITRYEKLLNEYNSVATESKKLYDAINSTLVSSPSI